MSKGIFVVYDKETTALIRHATSNGRRTDWYYGIGAAKAAVTRMQKKYLKDNGLMVSNDGPLFDYAIADRDYYYKNIEKRVTRKNFMTGEEFQESVNTPYYCSPSSETYWST
jgi:hypothetical protein